MAADTNPAKAFADNADAPDFEAICIPDAKLWICTKPARRDWTLNTSSRFLLQQDQAIAQFYGTNSSNYAMFSERCSSGRVILDEVDREILRVLEKDARASFSELGEHVGLSKTSCWNRARELEKQRTITGYRAELDPAQLGLHLHAFVQVTITTAQHVAFERAINKNSAVLECYTTAGSSDYLLHVLVRGIDELDTLLRGEIARMPGVKRLVTTVGMKIIKRRGLITDCASANST